MRRPNISFILLATLGLLVASGCGSRRLSFTTFCEDIQSPDPCVRLKAAIYAGTSKDQRAVPLLVDRLEDEDEAVRIATIDSLKQITGQDFGYRCFDPPYVRAKAVERWRAWLKTDYIKAPPQRGKS